MLNNINKTDLFYDYYAQWITVYKEGAIRKVTMDKYLLMQMPKSIGFVLWQQNR